MSYLFNAGKQLADSLQSEAIKSAKAAIMSRNMSHNIGSHVLYYLRQNLSRGIDNWDEILRSPV